MRALIVDDEPLARTALAQILAARSDVERFDAASDAIEAQELLSKNDYDVMLLDISMPELSGLELADHLQQGDRSSPSIVFITAYSQHALAAFEKHAVDYVLKPFSVERVNRALDFASRRTAAELAAKLIHLIPELRGQPQKPSPKLAIKTDKRILFIDPQELVAVQAEGNYVLLQRESGSYLLRESITAIAEKLKPYGFVRIHRSLLVNAAFVQEIRPCITGEYELRVKGGKEYTVTRTYKKNLKSLAQFWIGTGTFLAD
jgi:two-component system LytT family response regulator